MAITWLEDVRTVVLGGKDKTTGKKNPTELVGYFIRTEQRENRFNKDKPQNYYVLQTKEGEVGIYGKAGLDREMKKAYLGRLTHIVNTGETLDVGKGNPMTVYKVGQDRNDSIELPETSSNSSVEAAVNLGNNIESNEEQDFDGDEEDTQEALPPPPQKPSRPLSVTNAERAARVQAVLNKR